jgi:hypothetical protein
MYQAASRGADQRSMRTYSDLLAFNCVRDVGTIALADISRQTRPSRTASDASCTCTDRSRIRLKGLRVLAARRKSALGGA